MSEQTSNPSSEQRTAPPAVPLATVRFQFTKDFRFEHAAALVPYLASLGISHIYASPFLKARSGSTHGYDIIGHAEFNPEIGSHEDFERMVVALHAHGMGLILDFVPNHMGVGGHDNAWWLDVLEWGRTSPFASFFDIEWDPVESALSGKVLLPVLGDHYGLVLERGELELRLDEQRGTLSVWYYDHRFPVAPACYPGVFARAREALGESGKALDPLIEGFERIGHAGPSVQEQALARREADELRRQLAALLVSDPAAAEAVRSAVAAYKGSPEDPGSWVPLHELIEAQAYRLAFWRVASDEINYRRFFDVNDLAGLRIIENDQLFELAHQLVFRLIGDGKLQGLRLDHIDGLYDPVAYCRKLQDRAGYLLIQAHASGRGMAPPQHPTLALREPLYLLVEKILAHDEKLRPDWPVSGTTGYEFMNLVHGLFVDPAGEQPLTEAYERFIRREADYGEVAAEAKRLIITSNLASELKVLSSMLYRLARQNWSTRDFTLTGLRGALVDVATYFPVYRTYVTGEHIDETDRMYIDRAVEAAKLNTRAPDLSIYDFLRSVLTTDLARDPGKGYVAEDVIRFAMKFQQFTGPVTAKAVEDTTFYRFFRLVSLNEVGGEPAVWGTRPETFHKANDERLRALPFSMLATATHDHKRGEDTRVRIDVISEIAADWAARVERWAGMNRARVARIDGRPAPGLNDQYLFYQTVVGAWPLELRAPDSDGLGDFAERILAYMLKATRESKHRTSWTAPDQRYEKALESFVRTVLDPAQSGEFLRDLVAFQKRIAVAGAVNGLAQTLLRLTVPGVPDLYQGTEFWDQSLVDPDNRRPPDWEARRQALEAGGDAADASALLESWRDGRIKQHVIASTLRWRQRCPALFALGEYVPVAAEGEHAERVLAFLRRHEGCTMLVVVPRLAAGLIGEARTPLVPAEAWGNTRLRLGGQGGGSALTDRLFGLKLSPGEDGAIAVGDLLRSFPVGLFEAEG
ncbi:malto-oligosyltrehalose synthase [Arenibaculum pallidiluteum]|uniref:malto-oligosyltrehalose synthase n=1 Tax=Arenibaculum pallidiluteum TaxID=2812559 RepID=UPI001A9769C6|nr:malto-oligosyltrehalose synthase [Arenibaculum pallidiluteum]